MSAATMLTGDAARAEYQRAALAAVRAFNPSPAQQHLELLAFAAAVVRGAPAPFPSEVEQYLALHHAKRTQLRRPLWSGEGLALRRVSRALWDAVASTRTA